MIKVDLRKAYDLIDWVFLCLVMEEMGFPKNFVGWVMACVTSVSFFILVNGAPLKIFVAKKGLRQGGPISPYLFSIGIEYLSRLVRKMNGFPSFTFHPRCKKVDITHLLVVDDLLMFCRADANSVTHMMRTFNRFSKASGLEANTSKKQCLSLKGR